MKIQYKVLKPFNLEGFRPVAVGELITMHPDDAIAYDLLDHLEEVKPKSKSK
jgi:hypothetical protein